jgi:hypothetical protein
LQDHPVALLDLQEIPEEIRPEPSKTYRYELLLTYPLGKAEQDIEDANQTRVPRLS